MGKEITEINKDTFWQLIEEAKGQCGKDMDAMLSWIKGRLSGMQPEQILKFHTVLHGYRDAAYKYGLWTAASLLMDGCTDDLFIDFRAWLIAQGKAVYMAALENPDSLAEVEQYGDCEFEMLSYVGNDAYNELTGRDVYEDYTAEMRNQMLAEVSGEIKYHPMIEYPLEIRDAVAVYPELGDRFVTRYGIQCFFMGSVWNTSLPGMKELVEKGADEARKFRRKQQRKNRDKKKKQDGQSR